MPVPMRIDFVSDIACPWCIIGLRGLEAALARAADAVAAEITFQPFELNPDMPAGGQNMVAYIGAKYGSAPEETMARRAAIAARAAGVGFAMNTTAESRVYNTFDAHRLLRWAEGTGRQAALKHALFAAYFTNGQDPSDPDVLAAAATAAGLDAAQARAVIASGRYAEDVRAAEDAWRGRGIQSVPAIVIDGKYLISGGQPPEEFERALRLIAAKAAETA